ncbi:uncharacterized protein LOC124880858 isoform X2 [Girardinichthys multiradiatus]|uniref:uncharacterized protein LOC124880858 isoform X2 n=1 Tax=Girardinichthys multiradiatus TaxID=208333 RepID=UPI001FAD859A|nr:uncharacterized protein LOC124880858 isoform X2 [Girardinichthys multiradiatus]
MKLLFQLRFLVLAISSVSRGHSVTSSPQVASHDSQDQDSANFTTWQSLNQTNDNLEKAPDNTSMATPTPVPSGPTSRPSSVTTVTFLGGELRESPTDDSVSTSKSSTSSKPVSVDKSGTSWGYVILVLIIILIIVLCIILFMLRRASRTYSFDLQRPAPCRNLYEPTGTFGQVYLDDLGSTHKDVISEDLSTPPVPNGTSPPLEEKAADEENAPQEQPGASDPPNSSSSSSSSLSGDDQTEKKSNQMSSNNLFFDVAEELPQQQLNENNNNPCGSSNPFVEINLDEPPWSDQLLTSPQPTSSVLPFSPFSFSPSSTSS